MSITRRGAPANTLTEPLGDARYQRKLRILDVEKDFGAIADYDRTTNTGTNNSQAFQDAADYAAEEGGLVWVPGTNYGLDAAPGQPCLVVGSFVPFLGPVRGRGASGSVGGATLTRMSNRILMQIHGTGSFLADPPGSQVRKPTFENLTFDGKDFASDIFDVRYVQTFNAQNCFWRAVTGGRWLYMREVFDYRFFNCEFEYGGSADGTIPGLQFHSEAGEDYTNQGHLYSPRFESFYGTALATTGTGTNEIFLSKAKFESLTSNQTPVKFSGATAVHMEPIQITTRGTTGNTIPSQIELVNSNGIYGIAFLEHRTVAGGGQLDKPVNVVNTPNIDLTAHGYSQIADCLAPSIVTTDLQHGATHSFKGNVVGDAKPIYRKKGISLDRGLTTPVTLTPQDEEYQMWNTAINSTTVIVNLPTEAQGAYDGLRFYLYRNAAGTSGILSVRRDGGTILRDLASPAVLEVVYNKKMSQWRSLGVKTF